MLKPNTHTVFVHSEGRELQFYSAEALRAYIVLAVASGEFVIFRDADQKLCGISRDSRTLQATGREVTDAEFEALLNSTAQRRQARTKNSPQPKTMAALLQDHFRG